MQGVMSPAGFCRSGVKVLMGATALAAAPFVAGLPAVAETTDRGAPASNAPLPTTAYGASKAAAPLGPMQIERRALAPKDVLLDVLYCGISHSDITSCSWRMADQVSSRAWAQDHRSRASSGR